MISTLWKRSYRLLCTVAYHTTTLWLFTVNDLKTMVFPSTAFAFFASSSTEGGTTFSFLDRVPHILLWTWINLLAFTVNNQRTQSAIMEDKFNKPWRPIPSGRLSPFRANIIGNLAYPIAQLVSVVLGGGLAQSAVLSILGYAYNELGGGGDCGPIVRNILNAAGFTSFASGALDVATGGGTAGTSPTMVAWLGITSAVVSTTVHAQDMYDTVGDAAAKRRTVPLVFGDKQARVSIAGAVMFWSAVCPYYWDTGISGLVLPTVLGIGVAWRTLCRTSPPDDRATFRIYNVWLVGIYSLPAMAQWISVAQRA